MDDEQWNSFLAEKVWVLTDARGTSFEWGLIKNAVRARDGVKGSGYIHRHYVPYLALRRGLSDGLSGLTRLQVCEVLLKIILHIYDACAETLPIKQLSPPPVNKTVEESLNAILARQTRYEMSGWINWALEAICDYPDNIFYGPGTGDSGGKCVDEPYGAAISAEQLSRVKKGAALLCSMKILEERLKSLVKADGTKIPGAMIKEY